MTKLKILVPVKRVLDYQLKPLLNKTHSGIETQGAKFSCNPFDDIAIEEALQLKTKFPDLVQSTHAVSIGTESNKDILRNCLAKGIDSVTLIETPPGVDTTGSNIASSLEPLAVARILSKFVTDNGFNFVIMGKQAVDDDFNSTGQMLAAMLKWSQALNACKVDLDSMGKSVTVTSESDGGETVVRAQLPVVVTTDLRLNQPRYVGLPKLMKVKRKPIPKLSIETDFKEVDISNRLKVLSVDQPKQKAPGVIVKDVDELVAKLKESRVI